MQARTSAGSPLGLADPAAARLVRLSRAMGWVTTVGIVLIVALVGAAFVVPSWARNLLLAKLGDIGNRLPLDAGNQALAAIIIAVPIAVMLWGLLNVRALFGEFARGQVFTATAATHLQRFGIAVLAQGALGPITATALALALSLGNPPGQRMLVLTLSSNDYVSVIVGGVLIAVATVMREATRLADENASFV
ncbi:hypothetical protein BJ123_11339 [Rhodopseudomonas thermotolerans]|uniref:DUF2975 family protein n=2 Tax=Rhodopseudomonas TaxID=1073 RepID=A0A336K013_9BRAD|nr:hypothetical protein BJ125_11339 [Rhodopseudomonas pentothenatexigens]REF93330.1 hypothetical protein BJ123_11339 [Rhodopseudomonas thermotolerans]SSW91621.1 hypothetical protein SAMN05892882_11339 [Rhodopseudomonas pentothenatexigens]